MDHIRLISDLRSAWFQAQPGDIVGVMTDGTLLATAATDVDTTLPVANLVDDLSAPHPSPLDRHPIVVVHSMMASKYQVFIYLS